MATLARRQSKSTPPPRRHLPTTSSWPCPRGTTPSWASAACGCLAGKKAAHCHRPRHLEEPAAAVAGRSHQRAGRRERTHGAGRAGHRHEAPHRAAHHLVIATGWPRCKTPTASWCWSMAASSSKGHATLMAGPGRVRAAGAAAVHRIKPGTGAAATTIAGCSTLFLSSPKSPNTGNVIRLAANTGCTLHLVEPLGFSMEDRLMRRAGLDYHEYAQVIKHRNWAAFLSEAQPDPPACLP